MNNSEEFDRAMEDLVQAETELEPTIVTVDEDDMGDEFAALEALLDPSDDFDDPFEEDVTPLDSEDFGEYYVEGGRREKANQSRGIANQRNIGRLNKSIGLNKKMALKNRKILAREVKRGRIGEARNRKAIRRLKIDSRRIKRTVGVVGRKAASNTAGIEQMRLMAISKAIGNLAAPFAKTDLGRALPGIITELASVIPPSKKLNKWAVIGGSAALAGLSVGIADRIFPKPVETSSGNAEASGE